MRTPSTQSRPPGPHFLRVWAGSEPATVTAAVKGDEVHIWSELRHTTDQRMVAACGPQLGRWRQVLIAAMDQDDPGRWPCRRDLRQSLRVIVGKAEFDRDGFALDIAGVLETLTEATDRFGDGFRQCGVWKPDHGYRRLLRARRERPRGRRAAEQRDELATLQSIESHLLPQPGSPRIIPDWQGPSQGLAAARDLSPPDVRVGVRRGGLAVLSSARHARIPPKATIGEFRFTPNSERRADTVDRPFVPTSDACARSD